MKCILPKKYINKDTILNICSLNDDATILNNVAGSTLEDLYSYAYPGSSAQGLTDIELVHKLREYVMAPGPVTEINKIPAVSRGGITTVAPREEVLSVEILPNVVVKVLRHDNGNLDVEVHREGYSVYCLEVDPHRQNHKEYNIFDLGSGISSKGDCYISFALEETDDNAEMPYGRTIAIIIHADGHGECVDKGYWTDSETGTNLEYSQEDEKFVTFRPMSQGSWS